MAKSRKRLDRAAFRTWAVPIVLGYFLVMILTMGSADTASGAFNFVLLILLAIALARRFRDIGWPAWIGPTILLGTMFGLPFIALFYVMTMRYVDDHLMHAIAHLVALVLLVVAGSVPGKTASSTETVQAFE